MARMWDIRGVYSVSVRKHERKRPLGRRRRRWEDNIKMDLKEIGWEWSRLIWLRIGKSGGLL